MASKKASWLNHFKPGPLCGRCGANMRFVRSVTNTLRLVLNVLSSMFFANIIPVWYRCPKCGTLDSTSD